MRRPLSPAVPQSGVSPIELAGPPSYCEEHTAARPSVTRDSVMSAVAQLPRPARPAPGARPGPPGVLAQVTSYLGATWVLAAAGVVILVVSMVLMAHSAPGQRTAPARPPSHSVQYERAQYERAHYEPGQHRAP
jgi:hypothetical protein